MIIDIEDPKRLLLSIGVEVDTSPLFNEDWYKREYGDLAAGASAVQHFIEVGLREGRNPNAFFDSSWYYHTYSDVKAARVSAFIHFVEYGWREGRDPGPWFSTSSYLVSNPDVAAARVNPLLHYLEYGEQEGRHPMGRPVVLTTAAFKVLSADKAALLAREWAAEFEKRGVHVNFSVEAEPTWRELPGRIVKRFLKEVQGGEGTLTVSINGAGLDVGAVRARRSAVLVVADDPAKITQIRSGLRSAPASAHGATSSLECVAALSPEIVAHTGTTWFPEPRMSGAMLPLDGERSIPIAWLQPSPNAPTGAATLTSSEIIHRLGPYGLRLISDPAWREFEPAIPNLKDSGTYDESLSHRPIALSSLGQAKLALVTPRQTRREEVTPPMMLALGSGALPVADYALAPALAELLGRDFPVPLFKSLEELETMASHFLTFEDERHQLAAECQSRTAGLATYSTRVGEFMRRLGTSPPFSADKLSQSVRARPR